MHLRSTVETSFMVSPQRVLSCLFRFYIYSRIKAIKATQKKCVFYRTRPSDKRIDPPTIAQIQELFHRRTYLSTPSYQSHIIVHLPHIHPSHLNARIESRSISTKLFRRSNNNSNNNRTQTTRNSDQAPSIQPSIHPRYYTRGGPEPIAISFYLFTKTCGFVIELFCWTSHVSSMPSSRTPSVRTRGTARGYYLTHWYRKCVFSPKSVSFRPFMSEHT